MGLGNAGPSQHDTPPPSYGLEAYAKENIALPTGTLYSVRWPDEA